MAISRNTNCAKHPSGPAGGGATTLATAGQPGSGGPNFRYATIVLLSSARRVMYGRDAHELPESPIPTAWQNAFYAFVAEKERRSGSPRTVEGYSCMLQHRFSVVGKPPDEVSRPEVVAKARGIGLSAAATSRTLSALRRLGVRA